MQAARCIYIIRVCLLASKRINGNQNMVQYTWFQDGFKSTKETLLGGLVCFWLLDCRIVVLGYPCGVLQTSESRSAGPQDPIRPVDQNLKKLNKTIFVGKSSIFQPQNPQDNYSTVAPPSWAIYLRLLPLALIAKVLWWRLTEVQHE